MTKEELKLRTKKFAIRVFKLVSSLEHNQATKIISYQILKSASPVAANCRAAWRGKSDDDFLNKLKIVDEESDETSFGWSSSMT